MIEHQIIHYYQPTNNSCSQTSLAMVFSFFGKDMAPEAIMERLPVNKNAKGEDWGTVNQELAAWCLGQGFDVDLYTADFQIIDISWRSLSDEDKIKRIEATVGHRVIPSLGQEASGRYLKAYAAFIAAGGALHIEPYVQTNVLDRLIGASPVLAAVSLHVLHDIGHTKTVGLREVKFDDVDGESGTHSVVIYGKDDAGNYLVADPWQKPGRFVIEPERLLASMAAAQIECDNMFFQLTRKG